MPEDGVGLTLVSVKLAVPAAAVVKATKLEPWTLTVPENVAVVADGLVGDDESFDNRLQPVVSTAAATTRNAFMITVIGAAGGLLQRGGRERLRQGDRASECRKLRVMGHHMSRSVLVVALVAVVAAIPAHTQASAAAKKKLLFLTHAALYKHPSLAPAEKAVVEMGRTGGFDVTALEGYKQEPAALDMSFLTPAYLAQFDGLMLMTNGNLPLTALQKSAIVDFVRNGKALVGVHCASLTLYDYPEFGEVLGGYYRRSIVATNMVTAGKIGVLKVEDPTHPATKMLGGSWPLNEEFYQFGTAVWDASRPTEQISQVGRLHIPMAFSRDRVHVLLSLDTDKTDISDLGPEIRKGGDYPQAWTRTFGKGRSFYTALGHREDIWSNDAVFRAHVTGGIRWALGLEN